MLADGSLSRTISPDANTAGGLKLNEKEVRLGCASQIDSENRRNEGF